MSHPDARFLNRLNQSCGPPRASLRGFSPRVVQAVPQALSRLEVVPVIRLAAGTGQVNSDVQALKRKLFGLVQELGPGVEPTLVSLRSPVSEVQQPSGHLSPQPW